MKHATPNFYRLTLDSADAVLGDAYDATFNLNVAGFGQRLGHLPADGVSSHATPEGAVNWQLVPESFVVSCTDDEALITNPKPYMCTLPSLPAPGNSMASSGNPSTVIFTNRGRLFAQIVTRHTIGVQLTSPNLLSMLRVRFTDFTGATLAAGSWGTAPRWRLDFVLKAERM